MVLVLRFVRSEIEVPVNHGNETNDDKLTEDKANNPPSSSTAFEPTPLRRRDVFEHDFLLVRDDH